MPFSLSGLFQNHYISETAAGEALQASGEGLKVTDQRLLALTPGKTISGEVLGNNGSEIQIRLSTDLVVTARMEQPITAGIGQNVLFEIKSNSGGTLALRPLFENMAPDGNAGKALSMAGLPINDRSVGMTNSMMEEGMNVGRDALQKMYRQVAAFPEGDVRSIVQMNRLGIPVTAENLEQFEAYKNYEHKLTDAFMQAADEIPKTVEQVFTQQGSENGGALIRSLLSLFPFGTEMAEGVLAKADTALMTESAETAGIDVQAGTVGSLSGTTREEAAALEQDGFVLPEGQVAAKEAVAEKALPQNRSETGRVTAGIVQSAESVEILSAKDALELGALLKAAGAEPELIGKLESGVVTEWELYQSVRKMAQNAQGDSGHGENVKKLFLSSGFQKIFKNAMADQWTIKPESLEQKQVSKLYERINEQTRQLARALTEAAGSDTPLAKTVSQIRENVDFLNQMNQIYTYVQLPLKLKGNSAHGDLYVYTNKKNLAHRDGNVSALLQLDMEHLGHVSVYVAMRQEKITTNFYLQDEESLKLIEDHLDVLTKRLQDRGYSVQAGCVLQKEQRTVMDEILSSDKNVSIMSKTSFDVRA
ncbi:MAG: flagellar hook-length control protein FliK [Lachnospiraceae bacterium]|nr:flagellar hook-length control protein FliK [Lachnospiraceae bacterium]